MTKTKSHTSKVKCCCQKCNKTFFVYPSVFKTRGAKFCGLTCFRIRDLTKRTCHFCKKELWLGNFRNKAKQVFCNNFCRRKGKKLSIRKCRTCGNKITLTPRERKENRSFCNVTCYSKFHAWTPEKFWNQVRKTKTCWIWCGSRANGKYGNSYIRGRSTRNAHRVAWELTYGPIPDKKILVCHNCPGGEREDCVRPSHMFLGSHRDNFRDAMKKKRWKPKYGENNPASKLTVKKVKQIRKMYKTGNYSTVDLEKIFGIANTNICRVINRKTWKHVP